MGWGAVLKTAVKATGKSAGSVVIHPQQTIRGTGKALTSAATGSAAAYIGWQTLVNDKSVVGTVSEKVLGEETTERISNAIDGVVNVTEKASEAVDGVNQATSNVNSGLGGITDFFKNLFSGNGGDMIGNLFSNIGKGNVSAMSMVGLAAAAFLSFGRFGWMGRIAGLLLGALLIGNNSKVQETNTASSGVAQSAQQEQTQEEEQRRGMRR